VGCWRGYLSGARFRLAYGPADVTVSCFSKIQIGFTFLVLAHPDSPGQRAVKRVCVCVCLCVFAVCALKLLLVSHKKVYLICKKLYVKVSLEMTCLTNGEIFGEYAS